ncbi:hypothetical protein LF1_22040 [Rubripirellula obstinata]|uniref:GHMP kinase C-terminal domain-containing protein n=1 Tax=Rubripirellula obstinata TaxID=406547 RepID=A0A5B1CIW9_9BACT|nr:hypothetical protein [Rubripirellula obstinata]KAA1259669.1 hypothetical protein LF1_22040 [Rubripirellula obstinata]
MDKNDHGCITVTTGSRLHFGLLRTGSPFGGLGVMIDQPQNVISIEPSDYWQCDRQHSDRVMPIARRLAEHLESDQLPDCKLRIQQGLNSHCGLGSGTQLSLAVAEGLCRFANIEIPPLEIAIDIAERGKRSAVGVHGYFSGGLIYESPSLQDQSSERSLNRLIQRIELPDSWRIAFLLPPLSDESISGEDEAECFARLGNEEAKQTNQLRQAIEEQIIPAARTSDFEMFCDAVTDYNQRSGKLFADVQGGSYNGEEVTTLIQTLQGLGLKGVGQSSWGPGVFTWFDSQGSLEQFQHQSPGDRYRIMATSRVKNVGRTLVDSR